MRYHFSMRTTVNLEPEALAKAKMLSRQRGVSLGEAISQLILKSTESSSQGKKRNGVLVFPRRTGARVDIDLVNELRE
jgi:toxin-antitoxin system PIN domain toxin